MRKLTLNLLLLAIFGVFINSCTSGDPCKTTVCGANGNCFDGKCGCDLGYEGAKCETRWTDQFSGTWTGKTYFSYQNDTFPPFSKSYSTIITALDGTQMSVKNFGGVAGTLVFQLSKKNTFLIDAFNETDKIQFKGTAVLVNPNKIEFNYTQKNFVLKKKDFDCVGTLTK
jgi:hypothetical protein